MSFIDGMEDVTPATFKSTVTAAEPFSFAPFAAQDVTTSLRLTHLVYTPPTAAAGAGDAEWDAYAAAFPELCRGDTIYVRAVLRSQVLDGSLASFTVALFPLSRARLLEGRAAELLPGAAPTPLPVATDVAAGVDLRVDVDGSVELRVEGPGSVTFFGEQYASLIPEWKNHRLFSVDDDDEEGESMGSSDLDEMFRLARH